jgi:hypothetical protein
MTDEQQTWQSFLDQAAYFNILGVPDPQQPSVPIPMPGQPSSLAGVHFRGIGHRFAVAVQPPHPEDGIQASNDVGEAALTFSFRLLSIPSDFSVRPDCEPPPTLLDASHTQRIAIMDGDFCWGSNGEHRFTSIGAGRTFLLNGSGENTLRIVAVCAILKGCGLFQEAEGVLTLSGFFTPPNDFRFNIIIRLIDLPSRLLTTAALPPLQPQPLPDSDITYLIVYTRSQPETTTLTRVPGGPPSSLHTWERTRMFHTDFASLGRQGLKSQMEIGAVIGKHEVTTRFFAVPTALGTAEAPFPFEDVETFIFIDPNGKEIGSVTAPVLEGRSILTQIGIPPNVGSQFFGGFAVITSASGLFDGVDGIVTNVGCGTLDPHLTSICYAIEINDPTRRYRLG